MLAVRIPGDQPGWTTTMTSLPRTSVLCAALAAAVAAAAPPAHAADEILTPPSSPRNTRAEVLTITAGSPTEPVSTDVVRVRWDLPLTDGGSPVVGYRVDANTGDTCQTTSQKLYCDFSYLPPYLGVEFKVVAISAIGVSAASGPSRPVTLLEPPSGVKVKPGDRQVRVSWDPPPLGEVEEVLSYVVTTFPSRDGSPVCEVSYPTLSCVAEDLDNGTPYEATVTAIGLDGRWSAAPVSATPGLRMKVRKKTKKSRVRLSWTTVGAKRVQLRWKRQAPGSKTRTRKVTRNGQKTLVGPKGTRFKVRFKLTGTNGSTKTVKRTYRITK